jgi:DNA-binding response OmpR family regulator
MKNNKGILLVEDEEFIRNLVGMALTKEGYNVMMRADYNGAVAALNENSVDLVISDVMLPFSGGMDLLEFVKGNERLKNVPVILITGMDRKSLPANHTLAEAVVSKPFDMKELMSIVKGHFDGKQNSAI